MEEKQKKLLEKSKQDELKLAEMKAVVPTQHARTVISSSSSIAPGSSTVLTYVNQVPVQSAVAPSNSPFAAETMAAKSTSRPAPIPSVIPTTSAASIASATEKNQLPTQEQILKEIKVTLEERKKLYSFVSNYEKGLHDLQNGALLPNVRIYEFEAFMCRIRRKKR